MKDTHDLERRNLIMKGQTEVWSSRNSSQDRIKVEMGIMMVLAQSAHVLGEGTKPRHDW